MLGSAPLPSGRCGTVAYEAWCKPIVAAATRAAYDSEQASGVRQGYSVGQERHRRRIVAVLSTPEFAMESFGEAVVDVPCPACRARPSTPTVQTAAGTYCRCSQCGFLWHADGVRLERRHQIMNSHPRRRETDQT